MRHSLIFAMLMFVAAPAAGADVVDIKWSGDGKFAHGGTIAAGKFVEVCGNLPAGLKINWEYDASVPLDFNVHYHVGKEVVYPAQLAAVAKAGDVLATTSGQEYCWMWTNKSAAAAKFSVRLQR